MRHGPVERLRAAGLRVTPQRVAVLEALEACSHPTADEVYRRVAARYPQMGLATVYNTLAALARQGQVVAVNIAEGRRYDLRTDPHQHIRCRRCGRVDDLPPWEDPGWQAMAVPPGWAVERWTLLAEGVCPACSAGATAAAPSS
jgi:Fur family peroxide stress response transcriptional regulator